MKITEKQKEIMLNLLLEKMQAITECKNTDEKKALEQYKKDLHEIYGLVIVAHGWNDPMPIRFSGVDVEKTLTVCIDYEDLEKFTTEINVCAYWADLEEVENDKHMRSLITDEQFEGLKAGAFDYIVFKED